ncbi:hypothetical protein DFH27DRAFT_521457 [Peziza echinospora]|nr:hypothetical protein DFH27DRAFT_521457 [Peziza echinospora]
MPNPLSCLFPNLRSRLAASSAQSPRLQTQPPHAIRRWMSGVGTPALNSSIAQMLWILYTEAAPQAVQQMREQLQVTLGLSGYVATCLTTCSRLTTPYSSGGQVRLWKDHSRGRNPGNERFSEYYLTEWQTWIRSTGLMWLEANQHLFAYLGDVLRHVDPAAYERMSHLASSRAIPGLIARKGKPLTLKDKRAVCEVSGHSCSECPSKEYSLS